MTATNHRCHAVLDNGAACKSPVYLWKTVVYTATGGPNERVTAARLVDLCLAHLRQTTHGSIRVTGATGFWNVPERVHCACGATLTVGLTAWDKHTTKNKKHATWLAKQGGET